MGTGILKPGDRALDFRLVEAVSGQALGPADFAGRQSMMLLFYRGLW